MKCIQYYPPHTLNGQRVARVSDRDAEAEVKAGRAMYVPKATWKRVVRDADDQVID